MAHFEKIYIIAALLCPGICAAGPGCDEAILTDVTHLLQVKHKLNPGVDRSNASIQEAAADELELQQLGEKGITEVHASDPIMLKVKSPDGIEVQFEIQKSTPMRRLMEMYWNYLDSQASQDMWTGPFDTSVANINGNVGSSDVASVGDCKNRCVENARCEMILYSDRAAHCFLFNYQVAETSGTLATFQIYKYMRQAILSHSIVSDRSFSSQSRIGSINSIVSDPNRISSLDTAEGLGLQDGDVIDVVMSGSNTIRLNVRISKWAATDNGQQWISEGASHFGTEKAFPAIIMLRSEPFGRVMRTYCSELRLKESLVRFTIQHLYRSRSNLYDLVGGTKILPDDTAESLGLEDGDFIDLVSISSSIGA